MNKLIENSSSFFILSSIYFMCNKTDYYYKASVFCLFISSVFYHFFQYKSKEQYLNYHIYKRKKEYDYLKFIDKFLIANLYLYNSRIFNYSIILQLIICLEVCFEEQRLLLLVGSCFFL